MATYSAFSGMYSYARQNGYKGTYDEYVALQYKAYKARLKSSGINLKALSFEAWRDNQFTK